MNCGWTRDAGPLVAVLHGRGELLEPVCCRSGLLSLQIAAAREASTLSSMNCLTVINTTAIGCKFAMIFHIASQTDIDANAGNASYRCASLQIEGFIHCCCADQLAGVIERYYADVPDLLLITIDPDRLKAELVYENTVGGDELFPHVYGEINRDAVTEIAPLDSRR